MVTGKNKLKILTNHVSWKCEWKFDNRKWNNDKCWCECKAQRNAVGTRRILFGILLNVVVKMVNF